MDNHSGQPLSRSSSSQDLNPDRNEVSENRGVEASVEISRSDVEHEGPVESSVDTNFADENLHPEVTAILNERATENNKAFSDMSPQEARQAVTFTPGSERCHEVYDLKCDGVSCRFYRPARELEDCSPADAHVLGITVYFHGGGWVVGNTDSVDTVCRSLANRSGHCVLSVDYHLAPEHPFPVAVDECVSVVRWVHANADRKFGCDGECIAVAGDSAGGNLAAVVANECFIDLKLQVLIYPVTDCTPLVDEDAFEKHYGKDSKLALSYSDMKWFFQHYSPITALARNPRISPLLASDEVLAKAPPTLMILAECDVLRDEGVAYLRKLKSLGVKTTLVEFPGQIHGFFKFLSSMENAREALYHVAHALRRSLHRDPKRIESLFTAAAAAATGEAGAGDTLALPSGEVVGKRVVKKSLQAKASTKGTSGKGVSKTKTPHYAQPLKRSTHVPTFAQTETAASSEHSKVATSSPARAPKEDPSPALVNEDGEVIFPVWAADENNQSSSSSDNEEGADLEYVKYLIQKSSFTPLHSSETESSNLHENAASDFPAWSGQRMQQPGTQTPQQIEWQRRLLREQAERALEKKKDKKKAFESQYYHWVRSLDECKRPYKGNNWGQGHTKDANPHSSGTPPRVPSPEPDWVEEALAKSPEKSESKEVIDNQDSSSMNASISTTRSVDRVGGGARLRPMQRVERAPPSREIAKMQSSILQANVKSAEQRRSEREERMRSHSSHYKEWLRSVKAEKRPELQTQMDAIVHEGKARRQNKASELRLKQKQEKKENYIQTYIAGFKRNITKKLPKKAPVPRTEAGLRWRSRKPETWIAGTTAEGLEKQIMTRIQAPAPPEYEA
eukprot:GSChrysophyteH1.ASY1.ANO1.306.1 assembled CDS